MDDTIAWYVKADDGKVYGPADGEKLVTWARDGRIDPSSFISHDRISWIPAQMLPELEMKWLIETEPGKVFGPFNRAVAIRLFNEGEVPSSAKAYRLHEFAIDEDPPPVEKIVERIIEVPPPARTELVVAEVIEPVAAVPPVTSPGALFDNLDRTKLEALEAAARRELSVAHGGKLFGFLGGKNR